MRPHARTSTGHSPQRPWRPDAGRTASRIVQLKIDTKAHIPVAEVVEKIANMP